KTVLWSVIFAEIAAVGGLILSLAPGLPVSVFVTTISFAIYLVCRAVGVLKNRRAVRDDIAAKRDKAEFAATVSPRMGNEDPSQIHHTSHHDEHCDHIDDSALISWNNAGLHFKTPNAATFLFRRRTPKTARRICCWSFTVLCSRRM